MKRLIATALLALFATAAWATPALPERLQLDYTFYYEGIAIGKVTKTLQHASGDEYDHSMWTRPIGIARAFTSVEMYEKGRFELMGKNIRPLNYTEQRTGDKRAYKRTVTFDWQARLLRFQDRKIPMIPGVQDQSSVLYWFMINPPPPPVSQQVAITDAKSVDPYTFQYVRHEKIDTVFGHIDTVVVRRLTPRQVLLNDLCQHPKTPQDRQACAQPVDDFTVWLAPSHHYVPVKLRKRKNNQTLTLVLDSMTGQWPTNHPPAAAETVKGGINGQRRPS